MRLQDVKSSKSKGLLPPSFLSSSSELGFLYSVGSREMKMEPGKKGINESSPHISLLSLFSRKRKKEKEDGLMQFLEIRKKI